MTHASFRPAHAHTHTFMFHSPGRDARARLDRGVLLLLQPFSPPSSPSVSVCLLAEG